LAGCYDSLYQYRLAIWDSISIGAYLAALREGKQGSGVRAARVCTLVCVQTCGRAQFHLGMSLSESAFCCNIRYPISRF